MDVGVILSGTFITEHNVEMLKRVYERDHLLSPIFYMHQPIEVGCVIVVRVLVVPDLFHPEFFHRIVESKWIVTREEFDAKFVVVDNGVRTDTFSHLILK